MPTDQTDGNITRFEGLKGYPKCMLQRYSSQPSGPQGAGGYICIYIYIYMQAEKERPPPGPPRAPQGPQPTPGPPTRFQDGLPNGPNLAP